ncbi:MAG: efflux RND transporter periplasmic adaptor subunit [Opitutaceae bacterium]
MSFLKKFLVFLVVVAVAAVGANYALRPEALCKPVTRGDAVDVVTGSVTVIAEYSPPLVAEVGGRLLNSELDPGRTFKAGEILARIDPADTQLEIDRIEIDMAEARKKIALGSPIELELKSKEEELAELEIKFANGNFPPNEMVRQRRSVDAIRKRLETERIGDAAVIKRYENTLAQKKRQLAKMEIVAPFDGVVAEDLTTPRQLIGDHTPIAKLIATKRTIEARISEENFADIKVGQSAPSVRFLVYDPRLFKGTVSKILPTADPTTQRYAVHLKVDDIEPEKLVPGLTGEVSILTGTHPNALNIPRRALRGSHVFVVNDNRVSFRKIETGFTSLNEVEVLSGLNEGDLVVVDQLDKFRDGDRVKVVIEAGSKM